MLTFQEYQVQSRKTAIYPQIGKNVVYPALGLGGEAGEVAQKVKEAITKNRGIIDDKIRTELKKELGDVLWYLSAVATELNLDLNEVAEGNLEKLASRQKRNVVQGSGDNR